MYFEVALVYYIGAVEQLKKKRFSLVNALCRYYFK